MPAEPRAAYRVQLRPGFGFDEAAALCEYLAALGVSHFFASPYLQAAPGSTHGYDIVDPTRVNAELGGEPAHARFTAALARHGLAQMLDVVPNHMAVAGRSNPWWWDVLKHGPASRYARYFDVDWEPPEARLQNRVMLPVLGSHYGRVLEAGEIRVVLEDGELVVRYHEHVFPVDPASVGPELAGAGEAAVSDAALARLNADADALDALLERKNYRLSYWRAAGRDLGYRRFFDITHLAGLRVEDPAVFNDSHARILGWVRNGTLQALRIDHPDGLRDPQGYLRRLRDECPEAWIVVEKILLPGESLPEDWPVDGTTGYEFMNLATGLQVDPAGEAPLTALYAELTGEAADCAALALASKREALTELLGSDLNRLTALFVAICERHRRHRDYTRHELHEALRELAVHFPVYRSYVRPAERKVSAVDDERICGAAAAAAQARPDLDPELLKFLCDILRLRVPGELESELAARFQQLSAPAMAKGVEDTLFYRYVRLACLNEVGGEPARFGVEPDAFHEFGTQVQARRPRTLLATSNHDTKRSGDVRARIALLSEMPERWAAAVRNWKSHNARHARGEAPGPALEYLLYQVLVGAWPIDADRATAYMEKAAREAKQRTSWLRPDKAYEDGVRAFVTAILADAEFRASLEAFVAPLVAPGRVNSLAQTLLKLAAPGVPDIYQGTELWDLSLVDPDNRRPVDFAQRARLLQALEGATPEQVMAGADEGLPKLWLIRQALHLRRERPAPFGPRSAYRPLASRGTRAAHALAFLRGDEVAAVLPRLVLGLRGDWGNTTLELPPGTWRNVLTGESRPGGAARLAELLARFPVALLAREPGAGA
jgi:(1->4)-alpha-D-glucan 1-alpha-D-glucosylmutase